MNRFVEEGARVVAVDRAEDRVAEVEKAHGEEVAGVVADVTSAEDNERAVAEGMARFGQIDVFIGNAGIFDFGASFVDTPIDRLERDSMSCSLSTSRGTCSESKQRSVP